MSGFADFAQRNGYSLGGQGGGSRGGGWGNWNNGGGGGGTNWNRFDQLRQQLQQAQQQQYQINYNNNPYTMQGNPFYQGVPNYYQPDENRNQVEQRDDDKDRNRFTLVDENGQRWRRAEGPIEGIMGGLNQATNALNSYSGWNPEAGFTPENIGRFVVGIPGMMASVATELPVVAGEALSGVPYRDITQYDNDGKTETIIPDRMLTNTERAADVGYTALDVASMLPGVGLEARAAGLAARGIGKLGGISSKAFTKAADSAATGMAKQAGVLERAAAAEGATGAKLKAAAVGDSVASVGSTTLFEGAQEAGQQVFDDIRYDQLDEDTLGRAAEAGTWGALGGLAFGTGFEALDSISKTRFKKNSALATQGDEGFVPTTDEQWSQLGKSQGQSGVDIPAMHQYNIDQAREDSRLSHPGSINILNAQADAKIKMHKGQVGVDDFIAAYRMDNESKSEIAREWCNIRKNKMSVEDAINEIDAAIDSHTVDINGETRQFSSSSQALDALVEKYWGQNGGPRIAIHRNPTSKWNGRFYLTFGGFFDGSGLKTHPLVSPLVGQDFDGDKPSVQLVTKFADGSDVYNIAGYAPELILSRNGRAMTDFWYSDFSKGRYISNRFKEKLQQVLSPYTHSDRITNEVTAAMDEAVSRGDNDAIANILGRLNDTIRDMRRDTNMYVDSSQFGQTQAEYSALGDIINYLEDSSTATTIKHWKTVKSRIYAPQVLDMIESDETISEEDKVKLFRGVDRSPLYRHGVLGATDHAGEYFEDLGLAVYSVTRVVNQPMRQHGQLNLTFAKKQAAYKNLERFCSTYNFGSDVLDALVRISFRIARQSTTPLTAVEGMLDTRVASETLRRSGVATKKIKSAQEWESFLDILEEEYRRSCATYDAVRDVQTAQGVETESGVERPPVDRKNKVAMNELVIRIFGEVPIEDVLDEKIVADGFARMPFEEAARTFNSDPARFSFIFTEACDEDLEKSMSDLFDAYGSSKRKIGKAIENQVRSIDTSKIYSRMVADENGVLRIDKRDYAAVRWLANDLTEQLSPAGIQALGISDPIYFFEETDFGKMFLGGNENVKLNVFYSLLAKSQFITIEDALNGKIGNTDQEKANARENALIALHDMQENMFEMSPIKSMIATELTLSAENESVGNIHSLILDGLSSINITYDDKVNALNQRYGDEFPNMDPVADLLIEETGDFAISSLSRRRGRAEQSIIKYQNALRKQDEDEVSAIETLVADGAVSEEMVSAVINSAVQCANVDISLDAFIGTIYDAGGTGLTFGEKGINPASSSGAGESLETYKTGSPMSLIDYMTSYAGGEISASDLGKNRKLWLHLFANPHEEINVYDDSGSDANYRPKFSGDWVFSKVSPGYNPEVGPEYADWMALLNRYPQFVGMISDNVIDQAFSGGTANAVLTQKGTLSEKILEFNNASTEASLGAEDKMALMQVSNGISRIANMLLEDGRYGQMIIHCMQDMGVEEGASLESIRSQTHKLHRDFAAAFFFTVQHRMSDGAHGLYEDIKADYAQRVHISTFVDLNEMLNEAVDRIDINGIQIEEANNAVRDLNAIQNRDEMRSELKLFLDNLLNTSGEIDEQQTGESTRLRDVKLEEALAKAHVTMAQLANVLGQHTDAVFGLDENNQVFVDPDFSSSYGVNIDDVKAAAREYLDYLQGKGNFTLTADQAERVDRALDSFFEEFKKRDYHDIREDALTNPDFDLTEDDFVDIPYLMITDIPVHIEPQTNLSSVFANVKSRLSNIAKYSGDERQFSEVDLSTIESMYDETGARISRKWDAFVESANALVVEQAIRDLNLEWDISANKNAFLAQQSYMCAFDDLLDKAYDTLSDAPNPFVHDQNLLFNDLKKIDSIWEKSYDNVSFPTPDFTKAANQKASTDYMNQMLGALVPGRINRNGGMLKKIFGSNYLPTDRIGDIEPTIYTFGQLQNMMMHPETYGDIRQWRYVKSGTWSPEQDSIVNGDWEIGVVGNIFDNSFSPTSSIIDSFGADAGADIDQIQIQVFDPNDNPHGIWMTNSPAAISSKHKQSLQYNNIMSEILSMSQEDLVLKLKKKFQEKTDLVEGRGFNIRSKFTVDLSDVDNYHDMRVALKTMLLDYRTKYEKAFMEMFKDGGELDSLHYGQDQARILAQALTPAVTVEVNGREYSISASKLWNDSKFESWFIDRAKTDLSFASYMDGRTVATLGRCDVLSVSPTQISAQANKAADVYNMKCQKNGSKPSKRELSNRVYLMLTDGWDHYLDTPLSLDDIMVQVDSTDYTAGAHIPLEESLTKYQQFVDSITGQRSGSRVTYAPPKGKPLNAKTNLSLMEASGDATKAIIGKRSNYRIIRMFVSEVDKNNYMYEGASFVNELTVNHGYYWPRSTKAGAAIVTDASQLDAAISWAKSTNSHLLVTPTVLFNLDAKTRREYNCQFGATTRQTNTALFDLNPSATTYRKAMSHDKRESGTVPFDPDSIEGVYIDGVFGHFFNIGDASIIATNDLYQGYHHYGNMKVTGNELTGGKGRVKICQNAELSQLYDKLFDDSTKAFTTDPKAWEEAGFYFDAQRYKELKNENMMDMVGDFLKSFDSNGVDDDGINRAGAGGNKVLAIVGVTNSSGSTVYAPIIAPKNSPKFYDHCFFRYDKTGDIYIGFTSNVDVFGGPRQQYFKIAIENEMFKGIVTVADESNVEFPTYGKNEGTVKMVATYDTEKSRTPGRTLQIMQGSMWYFAKKKGFDLFRNEDGSLKESIVDNVRKTKGNETERFIELLINGEDPAWEQVASGSVELFEDAGRNRVISKVVKSQLNHISMNGLFCNRRADGGMVKTNVRFYMALQNLNWNDTLLFFNALDDSMCPRGQDDLTPEYHYWFNTDGNFRCNYGGSVMFLPVRWGPHPAIGDFSEAEGSGGKANETNQGLLWSAMDNGGPISNDVQTILDFSSFQVNNPSFYRQRMRDKLTKSPNSNTIKATQSNRRVTSGFETRMASPREMKARRREMAIGESFSYDKDKRRTYYGDDKSVVDNPFSDERVQAACANLNKALGFQPSPRLIEILSICDTGHTYSDGKGANSISVRSFAESINRVASSIRDNGLPVMAERSFGNRISQPLIPQEIARILWNRSENIRMHDDNNNDFETYRDRMIKEQDKTFDIVNSLPDKYRAKQRELFYANDWLRHQWDLPSKNRVYEDVFTPDIFNTTTWLTEAIPKEALGDDFDMAAYREQQQRMEKAMMDRRAYVEGLGHAVKVENPNTEDGDIVAYRNIGKHWNWLSHLTDLTKSLGVLDLFMPISNIAFRGAHQTMMSRLMALGRNGNILSKLSPYRVEQGLNQKIVRNVAARDDSGFKMWMVLHDAALTNEEMEAMLSLEDSGSIEAWVNRKANEPGLPGHLNRFKDLAMSFASGGPVLMRQQFANFINRFAVYCNEDPVLRARWLSKNEFGDTQLDAMLAEPDGSAAFLKEVFARSENNVSYMAAQNALQDVRSADIAQDHILIEIFKNATRKHPLPEFLVTTLFCRFPRYSLNFTEEILNFVMPMSSLRYIFTDIAAEIGHERAERAAQNGEIYVDPHYEKLQRNTGLKEAMMVDMLHFGPAIMTMIVAALPGAVEPPEDDKKWGNPNEWMLFGYRAAEAWWVEDLLGLVVPSACFQKSVQLGKPRLDLLVNGVANICYSNPMLKIADVVSFMMDPTDGLYADYEEMRERYANSRGGDFGFMDYINASATTFGLSYASQFVTPTFIKSAWQMAMPYEYDYKRIYEMNDRGVLTEEGQAGENLIMTDFDDAMIRRLTRKNPVLALVMDLSRPGATTSYSPLGFPGKMAMPLTRYVDQTQYAYMKEWSINGLSEEDKQAKIAQILVKLEEYQDDLDALVATGFYLDSGTKAAVSSAMWDRVYAMEQQWDLAKASGELDYYVLGNGDTTAGRHEYDRLYAMYKQAKNYYSDLYYKTMKSSQLNSSMVTYNRYNTSYAQDDDGNWYATGYHPAGVLPFISAPGRMDDPEGTAGYENDWVTISAVTGEPLEGMRALVPFRGDQYEEWPDLEEWSANKDGEGYSKQYQDWYGTSGIKFDDTNTTTKSGYPYSRSYGGYGGGGYRRYGGGGGGYRRGGSSFTPNIYAPSVDISNPRASRIMNTDRIQRPDLDYLRPDFETKGSREAYKRSDI